MIAIFLFAMATSTVIFRTWTFLVNITQFQCSSELGTTA